MALILYSDLSSEQYITVIFLSFSSEHPILRGSRLEGASLNQSNWFHKSKLEPDVSIYWLVKAGSNTIIPHD